MLLQLHCENKAHDQTIHRKFENALLQYLLKQSFSFVKVNSWH